ncbi:MAG: ankyrin repeat domain-containing protein [Bryobacteraceae bacterium]
MITRVFWTLFTLEAIAYAILMLWTLTSTKGWGPEGPVGAWLVFVVPPLLLGVPLAVFLLGKSDQARLFATLGLALPLIQIVIGPLYSRFQNYQTERSLAGDATFSRPAQRKLAHAIRAHDATLVKSLIPPAGDLNQRHRDHSLFRFALCNIDKSSASVEIIKAMLEAGANPKIQTPAGDWPLTLGMLSGPAVTELLLKAGADPNSLDGAGRPVWWQVLHHSSGESIHMLRMLLDRGADVIKRDSNNGPVGWAAYQKNWRAVWILIEHGAAWKGERAFDQPVPLELTRDLEYRRASRSEIPEEMLKVQAKYASETAPQ